MRLKVNFGVMFETFWLAFAGARQSARGVVGKQALFIVNLKTQMAGELSKACYLIWDTRTESNRLWHFRKDRYQTGREQVSFLEFFVAD
jgi:hypothetical protein